MSRPSTAPPSDFALDRICELAQRRLTPFASELELWRLRFRHEARENLFFLCRDVLQWTELTEEFHLPMCNRLDAKNWPQRSDGSWLMFMLDMWPRGGFKTTIGTKGRGIQTVIRNPEETILIGHGEQVKAQRILGEIKAQFESNEVLRWLFPDIIWDDPKNDAAKAGGQWSQTAIQLKRNGRYSEPTFTITSAESDETGGHYTLMLLDDMVTRKNSRTPEARQKVYEFITAMLFLKDQRDFPEGHPHRWPWMRGHVKVPFRAGMVATRWHYDDANSKMMKDDAFADDLNFFIQKAIQDDGTSFFPERFPLDELARKKKQWGTFLFNAQMQQDPSYEKDTVFPTDDARTFTPSKLRANLNCYTTMDPNNDADGEVRCNGVIQTWGIDIFGNRYLLRNDVGQFSGNQLINLMVEHVIEFNPRRSRIEGANFQSQLVGQVNEKLKAMGIRHRVEKLKRGGRGVQSKTDRIRDLEPLWKQGMIFVNHNDPSGKAFLDEAADFPHGLMDQLDCAQMANEIAVKPKARHDELRELVAAELEDQRKPGPDEVTGDQLLSSLGVQSKRKAPGRGRRLARLMRIDQKARRTRA